MLLPSNSLAHPPTNSRDDEASAVSPRAGYKGVQVLIAEPPPTEHLIEQPHVKDIQIAALNKQAADLTKMLLEKIPAGGPAAQQAVGAAVQSIAQGAAEGDSRLEKALGLLKENKLAEATQLLKDFAGDKEAGAEKATAQAEKDRKQAAEAYRNLGAIAELRDPKRALEAYEKALALDPDDIESLYWAGYIQIDYGDLNKAQKRLARVMQLAETGDEPFYKFWARNGLGDILVKQGDLQAALKSYQESLAIAERLAASDPGNAGWQRDLLVSYNKVGDVLVAQGNLPAALKTYQQGLAIADRLAQSEPGNAQWQYDLGISNERVGNVQLAQGNLSAALKSYEAQHEIISRLAQSDPGNAKWQRDLSVSFAKLADVHKQSGDKARARDYLRQGQTIMARLTKLSPENAQWKSELAWFDSEIAKLERATANVRSSPRRSKHR